MPDAQPARIRALDIADPAAVLAITDVLGEATLARGFTYSPQQVTVVLERDDTSVCGGLVGEITWDWLFVRLLAVDESVRGHGFGRRLVEHAEAIARDHGCVGAWVDTYSFQAPAFYAALGYEEFGRLDNHPVGEARIFFRKTFATPDTPMGAP